MMVIKSDAAPVTITDPAKTDISMNEEGLAPWVYTFTIYYRQAGRQV